MLNYPTADESADLLVAGEQLADAVELYRSIAKQSQPEREDYDDDEEHNFKMALADFENDCLAASASLDRAIREYRRAQERALSARIIAHCQPRSVEQVPSTAR